MRVLAAAGGHAAIGFIEVGALALVLSVLARLASKAGITAIPLYLLAGLAVGKGGLAPLDVSSDFIRTTAEIGVLLLLLTLGLEYSADELRVGLRTGLIPGVVDAVANFTPGFALGLLLGWGATAAIVLGGVSWVSSSGVTSKVLSDLGWLRNRETPGVLSILVIEDLAMAAYLPTVGALVAGRRPAVTVLTVAVALGAAGLILFSALRYGNRLSALLSSGSDEALLLAVFGLTLLVGGLAEQVRVSAAIGAFLVGLALSGSVQHRAAALVAPLRDLFAAVFFVFFSFQIEPGSLAGVLAPAAALAAIGIAGKYATGAAATRPLDDGTRARRRAGAALVARGEFSIVIASLAAGTPHGERLGALAAGYVLLTALAGPLIAKWAGRPAPSALSAPGDVPEVDP